MNEDEGPSHNSFPKIKIELQKNVSPDLQVINRNGTGIAAPKKDDDVKPSPPRDRFCLIYCFFLYFGLSSIINTTYVFSANDFWMWKFRNTSKPWSGSGDAQHRTGLQATVFSSISSAYAIPALLSLALTIPIVKRTRTRPRIYTCYSVYITVYCLFLVLALVNTDTWQNELAYVALFLAALNASISMILLTSCITLLAYLPQNYVKAFALGEGSSQLVTSVLQITCLLIGGNSQMTGLIYFTIGIIIYASAMSMYIGTQRSAFFRYYIDDTGGLDNKPATMIKPTLADFKIAFSEVWPVIAVFACCIVGANMDNITSLIVSENRGDQTLWTETYFVPVISMFLGNVCGILGRIFSWNLITFENYNYVIGINIIRALIYLPLYIGCNAFPRTLPIWFPHDWQYIIILTTFTFTNGFFTTSCILSLPNFMTGKVQKEIYYILLQITLSAVGFCTAPLNVIVVKFIL